jgi:hypothetical protein
MAMSPVCVCFACATVLWHSSASAGLIIRCTKKGKASELINGVFFEKEKIWTTPKRK